MNRRCLFGTLAAVPAVLLGSLPFLAFETGAYYTRPWQIAAIVFFLASFLFGWTIPQRKLVNGRVSSTVIRKLLFRRAVYAWMLAVVAVFVASLTPLCVGQDNGDGVNSRQMCLIFAIGSSLVYSATSIPVILISSFVLAPILLRCPPSRAARL